VVTELRNRGVQDIFIACVDGLKVHIPAHRDRPFRLNVTACSGLS
jgi:hypothetical protein